MLQQLLDKKLYIWECVTLHGRDNIHLSHIWKVFTKDLFLREKFIREKFHTFFADDLFNATNASLYILSLKKKFDGLARRKTLLINILCFSLCAIVSYALCKTVLHSLGFKNVIVFCIRLVLSSLHPNATN